jgi:hypothetical protein
MNDDLGRKIHNAIQTVITGQQEAYMRDLQSEIIPVMNLYGWYTPVFNYTDNSEYGNNYITFRRGEMFLEIYAYINYSIPQERLIYAHTKYRAVITSPKPILGPDEYGLLLSVEEKCVDDDGAIFYRLNAEDFFLYQYRKRKFWSKFQLFLIDLLTFLTFITTMETYKTKEKNDE